MPFATVTPYLVVEPGAWDFRSSSISQHVVLHAFDTGMLPHLGTEWRLIILHFCWREQTNTGPLRRVCTAKTECDAPVITLGAVFNSCGFKYKEGLWKELEKYSTHDC